MTVTCEQGDKPGPDDPATTNNDDFHPLPPWSLAGLTRNRSCESLDELERLFDDLPPAGVDRQRVPAARQLANLGHALFRVWLL